MKVDDICDRYANLKVGLRFDLLKEGDHGEPTTVLIEGSASALKMLAELLVAIADEAQNESFSISPFGPGSIHFSRKSKLGVYIQRVDSVEISS